MYAYRTPGVYFEWPDIAPPALNRIRTDIAGFVGISAAGPLHRPLKIESWNQFLSIFGAHIPQGYLAYAVEGFFANGGQTCWVVRVADPQTASPAWLDLLDDSGRPTLRLTAHYAADDLPNPGVWANEITVNITRSEDRFTLRLGLPDGRTETWPNLTMANSEANQRAKSQLPRNVETVLNDPATGSRLVRAEDLNSPARNRTPNQRVLRPYVDLLDPTGRPALRLASTAQDLVGPIATISVLTDGQAGYALQISSPYFRPQRVPAKAFVSLNELRNHMLDPQTGPSLLTVAGGANAGLDGATLVQQEVTLQACPWRLQGGRDGLAPTVVLNDRLGQPTLRLTQLGAKPYGQTIDIAAQAVDQTRFSLTIDGQQIENLTMCPGQPRFVETVINDRRSLQRLVVAQTLPNPSGFPHNTPAPVSTRLDGGLDPVHFDRKGATIADDWGLAGLERIDAVSIIAMPDIMSTPVIQPAKKKHPPNCAILPAEPPLPPAPDIPLEFPPHFDQRDDTISRLQFAMVAHCEKLKDRIAILDSLRSQVQAETGLPQVIDWRNQFDTKYAALYYPWLRAPDVLALSGLLRTIPPCGHMAGIYARSDRTVGVHKPPANERVEGIKDVSLPTDDRVHGILNDESINVIRLFNGRGLRLAGARTLSSDIEWRYINVRRLLIMIAEAIDEGTQWIVFEPNNNELWLTTSRVIRTFLRSLWRQGMLDGASEEEAFSVRCDQATNPPFETDQGRLICEIGLNLPWPAEFVIVRIGKTENGIEILDEARA